MLFLYLSIKMFFKEDCDKEQLNLKVIPLFCTVRHPLRIKIATSKIVVIFYQSPKKRYQRPLL